MQPAIKRHTNRSAIWTGLVVFCSFPVFVYFSLEQYNFYAVTLAWLIFATGITPSVVYYLKRKNYIPIIESIMFAYVVAFSLPVFYQDHHFLGASGDLYPKDLPIVYTLFLALLAIICLYLGFSFAKTFYQALSIPRLQLSSSPRKLYYFGVIIALLSIFNIQYMVPVSFYHTVDVLVSPSLALSILALLHYRGLLSPMQSVISFMCLALILLEGLVSSMTQLLIQPLLIWFLCRWVVLQKFPVVFAISAVALFIVMQPVKLEYRHLVWGGNSDLYSTPEKLLLMQQLFVKHWIYGETVGTHRVVESTKSRTSLLLTTAHIIDWTPDVVPYQYGKTLEFLVIGWIPRFVWPDKPNAQEGNLHYAIQYGVTSMEGAKHSSFGAGHLGEIIMNFGGAGIIPCFFILGVLYFLPTYILSGNSIKIRSIQSGYRKFDVGQLALLVVCITQLMFIGSSISNVFGGILQLIIAQAALLHVFCRAQKQT